jgi:hypothetical protein
MKKILPVALLACLAGINGAHAVHVGLDGTVQVLLHPFYTSEVDQEATVSLVNTASESKAVQVRILEPVESVILFRPEYDEVVILTTETPDWDVFEVEGGSGNTKPVNNGSKATPADLLYEVGWRS